MNIDIYAKSVQLLERVANSVHDRDPKNPNLLTFSITEIHIVEEWMRELIKDLEKVDPNQDYIRSVNCI
jgi:hypothetical protein